MTDPSTPTTVTVVSWNLNHWQQSQAGQRPPAEAWEYLRNELSADIALVQEAASPTEFSPARVVGLAGREDGRAWGTGIVDFTGVGIEPVKTFAAPDRKSTMELRWSDPSAAAAAYIGTGHQRFLAVSLYGQFDGGSSYRSVLSHAADLAPLLNDFTNAKRTLIAGDLNLNGQWTGSEEWYNALERTILSTLSMWNMRDALADSAVQSATGCPCDQSTCRHVQTYWKPGSSTPWQNDHAFVSQALTINAIRVDSGAVTEHHLSDHAPIVIELQ